MCPETCGPLRLHPIIQEWMPVREIPKAAALVAVNIKVATRPCNCCCRSAGMVRLYMRPNAHELEHVSVSTVHLLGESELRMQMHLGCGSVQGCLDCQGSVYHWLRKPFWEFCDSPIQKALCQHSATQWPPLLHCLTLWDPCLVVGITSTINRSSTSNSTSIGYSTTIIIY